MSVKTPLEMLYEWERTAPEKLYLTQPIEGEYQTYTWGQVAQQVRHLAGYIQSLNLKANSHIAILSKNCAEWFITDLAIMLSGHISIPIYATAGADTISYVLNHADCSVVFIGKLDNTQEQVSAIPKDTLTIGFPYPDIPANNTWQQALSAPQYEGSPVPNLDSVMTIIYTSGSTGNPKGVVHTYHSVCWSAYGSLSSLGFSHQDRIVSYLPLAHITERVLVEFSSFYAGSQIYFVESLETFNRDVVNAKPTMFISVPRLWTKFQMGILANLSQAKLNLLLPLPFIGNLIRNKIKAKLGLSAARICASGSAPLSVATLEWFAKLDINISEGWGMTENCAYGTCCMPFRTDKLGTIGKPYPDVDIRIAEDGEIQLKGLCNMREYYLEPEKTAGAFTSDGYLRTGDRGAIDNEGFVTITGRLKEIFKTSKGKYVAPIAIETKLMANAFIEQICVSGTGLKQPIALVVLSEEAQALPKEEVEQSLKLTLLKVNKQLESHEKVDKLVLMQDEWRVDNGLLTPTLKIKRHTLERVYETLINGQSKGPIVWQ